MVKRLVLWSVFGLFLISLTITVVWYRPRVEFTVDRKLVGVEDNVYPRAVTGQRLVNAVVHYLVYAVVQPAGTGVPDIHRGPHPNGIYAFQNGNVGGVVLGPCFGCRHTGP